MGHTANDVTSLIHTGIDVVFSCWVAYYLLTKFNATLEALTGAINRISYMIENAPPTKCPFEHEVRK